MTDEIQQWIEEKCTEFEDIQWISKHLELYRPQTKNHRELDDLEHYGGNIHTWTLEAVQSYRKLQESLCNNPFMVMTEWSKKTYQYKPVCIDGCFISVEQSGHAVPVGFLKTAPEALQSSVAYCLKNAYEEWKKEYEEMKQKILRRVIDAEIECDAWKEMQLDQVDSMELKIDVFLNVIGIAMWGIMGIVAALFYPGHAQEDQTWVVFSGALFVIGCVVIYRLVKNTVDSLHGIANCKIWEAVCNKRDTLLAFQNDISEKEARYFTEKYILSSSSREESFCVQHEREEFHKIMKLADTSELKDLKMHSVPTPEQYRDTVFANKALAFVLGIIFLIFVIAMATGENVKFFSDEGLSQQEATEETSEEANNTATGFDENGLLFWDSNERYLSEDEIYALKNNEEYDFQTLLGFARNEIYARRGYAFKEDGPYYPFYMQYEWYSNMSHDVFGDEVFNEYEIANRDLIVEIEKREGYRE